MKTGFSTNQPLLNTWYTVFFELIVGEKTLRRFYRAKLNKKEQLTLEIITNRNTFRKALNRPHEVVPMVFGPGVEFNVIMHDKEKASMPSASRV